MIFDYRSAEGQLERLPQLAAEFVATNPDVIVTGFGTETAKAAQAASTTIPIVFTSAGDPVGAGIVKSLNRPGANMGWTDGRNLRLDVRWVTTCVSTNARNAKELVALQPDVILQTQPR